MLSVGWLELDRVLSVFPLPCPALGDGDLVVMFLAWIQGFSFEVYRVGCGFCLVLVDGDGGVGLVRNGVR